MIHIDAELSEVFPVLDRILLLPLEGEERLRSGLYLPPTVQEHITLGIGRVMRVGPGNPVPPLRTWLTATEQNLQKPQYVPLDVREGDLAVFLQKEAVEVYIRGKKHVLVPFHAILLLVRKAEETPATPPSLA